VGRTYDAEVPAAGSFVPARRKQRKALLRLLIKELCVMNREEILPRYRVPPVVRAPDGQVEVKGVEPSTSAVRRRFRPIPLPGTMAESGL